MPYFSTTLKNARCIVDGKAHNTSLTISDSTGLLSHIGDSGFIAKDVVDVKDYLIAPGFLELHTNGVDGFHFTHHGDSYTYHNNIDRVARHYASQGVTGFWATIPTVTKQRFNKILPYLQPRDIPRAASLLGAHAEGPYLNPIKRGAHNTNYLLSCDDASGATAFYGDDNLRNSVKLVTLAPELERANLIIKELRTYDIRVSMGHSIATFEQGYDALVAGATGITHTLNAMPGWESRSPGLPGLLTSRRRKVRGTVVEAPYHSIIADGHHLHPNTVALLYRANPKKAIIVTDSIELNGLPDGTYPGNAQIVSQQTKSGTRATIIGTDVLIGGCIPLQQSVRNLMEWTGISLPEAVMTVTENISKFMGLDGPGGRGVLKPGMRADFNVMTGDGRILETWIAGKRVWCLEDEIAVIEDSGESRG